MSVTVYTSFVLVCPAVIDLGHGSLTSLSLPSQTSPASLSNSGSANPSITAAPSQITGPSGKGIISDSSTFYPGSPDQTAGTYVLVPITTTLTVDVFPSGLTTFEGYRPTYNDYGDGSLVTTLFDAERHDAYMRIVFVGVYLALFIYTLSRSISYTRMAGPQARPMLSVLSISQLLGLASMLTVAVGYLSRTANCHGVDWVSAAFAQLSFSLLISGNLGFKVFRILNRPWFVLAPIIAFASISMALFFEELSRPGNDTNRLFTGECLPTRQLTYIPASLLCLAAELVYITGCFGYAVHKFQTLEFSQSHYDLTPLTSSSRAAPGSYPPPPLGAGLTSPITAATPRGFSETPGPGPSGHRPRSFGHGIGSALESGSYAYARIQNWLGLGGGSSGGGLPTHLSGSSDSNPLKPMKRRTSDAVRIPSPGDQTDLQNRRKSARNSGQSQGGHARAKSTGAAVTGLGGGTGTGAGGAYRRSAGGLSAYDLHLHDVPEITEDEQDGAVVLIEDIQPQSPLTPRSPRSPRFPASPYSPQDVRTNQRTGVATNDDRNISVGFSKATPYGLSVPAIDREGRGVGEHVATSSESGSGSAGSNTAMGKRTRSLGTSVIGGSRAVFMRTLRGELVVSIIVTILACVMTILSFIGPWARTVIIGSSVVLDAGWALSCLIVVIRSGSIVRRAERAKLLRHHSAALGRRPATRTIEPAGSDSLARPNSSGPDIGFDRIHDTASLTPSGVSSLVFASPEELVEEESVGFWMPIEEESAIGRRNVENWRDFIRTPSSGLWGHSRRPSAALEEGVTTTGIGSGEGTGATSLRSKPSVRRKVFAAPSLRSFSSYWAKSESTNVDAYRRQSYVPSVHTSQGPEDALEKFPMPPVPPIPPHLQVQSSTNSRPLTRNNSSNRPLQTPSAAGISIKNPFGSETAGSSLNAIDGHTGHGGPARPTLGRSSSLAPSAWAGHESVDGDWNGEEWVAIQQRLPQTGAGGGATAGVAADADRVSSFQVRELEAARPVQMHPAQITTSEPNLNTGEGPRLRHARSSSAPGGTLEKDSSGGLGTP